MRALLVVVLVGCYAPHAQPGAPCAAGDVCPMGLQCIAGTCEPPGTRAPDAPRSIDAPLPGVDGPRAADAAIDAPADAAPDAADPSLVAYWMFDDDPTDGALDATGNGHTAMCEAGCPTMIAGVHGGAYHFDPSVQQDLIVPDSTAFRGPYTISVWFRANASTASLSILAKPVGTATDNSWQLEMRETDYLSLSGGSVHYLDSAATVSRNTWHHAAGTWDGTTKTLYVDGAPVASVASTVSYDTHAVYLGADQNNGAVALPFSGDIDDVRIYNRALSASEIAALAH